MVNSPGFKETDWQQPTPVPRLEFQRGASAWKSHKKMVDILERIPPSMEAFPHLAVGLCSVPHTLGGHREGKRNWNLVMFHTCEKACSTLNVCCCGSYKAQLRRVFQAKAKNAELARAAWAHALGKVVKE